MKASIKELLDDRRPIDSDSGIAEQPTDAEPEPAEHNVIVNVCRKHWRGIAETVGALMIIVITLITTAKPPSVIAHDSPVPLKADPSIGCPSTDPADAFSVDHAKAWICADARNGVSETMSIHLPEPYKITEVGMVPGYDFKGPDGDRWKKYRTIGTAAWHFKLNGSSVKTVEQTFTSSRRQQTQNVDMLADAVDMVVLLTCPCKSSSGGMLPDLSKLDMPGVPTSTGPPSGGGLFASQKDEPTAFAVQSLEIVGHRPE